MASQSWEKLMKDLVSQDHKVYLKAARQLVKVANTTHVRDLYKLLKSDSFFVREVAADPLARLEGAAALPTLFDALEMGEEQGHDNDGLVNTIIGTLEK